MSTFKGVVAEFPDIRIDYFRTIADRVPPLACFLSHVHNDHLQGLESLKAPFVYCSSSTRELLLRIEKYPHRMNFAKGITEARRQHYRHLKMLLKPIPLNTPTEIELKPSCAIRVTLFDANHCPGAVMFLIEDHSKTILYTGDIRAEPWWVNSIVRQPAIIPYTNRLRALDKVYLDTTFAVDEDSYRTFPTKAQGLSELLTEVSKFPENTVFHFNAWTLGYEEAWVALAAHLKSQIHVDDYKWRLYSSLTTSSSTLTSVEGAALCGFQFGNRRQAGCLTTDDSVRLHSCEYGTQCRTLESSGNTVWIAPLISRSKEAIIPEVGAGGGGGDLIQTHELELADSQANDELIELCKDQITDGEGLDQTIHLIEDASCSRRKAVALNQLGVFLREDKIPLRSLAHLLSRLAKQEYSLQDSIRFPGCAFHELGPKPVRSPWQSKEDSSRRLFFPYSRHSSYDELCYFLSVLRPIDVYPCVTDKESWTSGVYIETLFGKLCSGSSFSYDEDVRLVKAKSGRPSCENSSSKDAHIRIDSTSSKQVLHNSDLVLGPASGPSSLNPLKSVGSEISRVTPSSSNFKKRRGIPRSSHRKKTQTTPWMHLQEPMKRKDDHAAAGTLSVWLESSDIDSDTSGRPGTKMVEDLNSITFVHGKRASASSARISVNGGRGRTLPSCRAMQSQDRLNSRGKHHRRPKADDTAYPHPNPASRDISTGIKPCVSRGGTPLIATKILDISESETGAGVVYNVQTRPDNPVEEAANSSQDLKTQLSAVQSIFGPQDPTQSPNAQRLQHRKDVYDRVKCDDGYAWGRDCGLLSTVMRHEHDEVEL